MFRVCTANVNGVRAAERRGGIDWLAQQSHDAVLMQEVRASDAQLDEALAGTDLGAAGVVHAPAEQAGRSGVAIVSRLPLTDPRVGLGAEEFSGSGRWIEATAPTPIGDVRLVSVYVHSGEAGTEKQEEKYRFLTAMTHRLGQLSATFEQVLVGGDINIAHTERDIRNAKGNRGRAGFLTEERAYLSGWLACGWVDLARSHHGDVDGPYTWWSWRGQAFDRDTGWRIDCAYATPALAARLTAADVGRAPSYAERWSDHAPLTLEFR